MTNGMMEHSSDDDDFDLDETVEQFQIQEAIDEEMFIINKTPSRPNSPNQSMEPSQVRALLMNDADSIDEDEVDLPKVAKSKFTLFNELMIYIFVIGHQDFMDEIKVMNRRPGTYPSNNNVYRETRSCKFTDMSSDVLVRVLKYLSITERVKAERINRSVAVAMAHVWATQRSLTVTLNPTIQQNFCSHKRHRFCFQDLFYDQENLNCHLDRSFFRVVKKCPNLRSLHLLSNPVSTKTFGSDLYKHCPNIEHVEIRDTTTFVSFSRYVGKGSKQLPNELKCIVLNEHDSEADEEIESSLIQVVSKSPKLDTFINFSIWNTEKLVEIVAPFVKEYRVNSFWNMSSVDTVCELGANNLTSFGIREILPLERAEGVIEKLVNVSKLEINIDGEELKSWYKTLTRLVRSESRVPLEELSLFPGYEYYDAKDNDNFLSNNGRSLRSLSLWSFQLRGHSLRYIHQFCPSLEELRVYARQELEMKPWFRSLARLIHLKKLELKEPVMTTQQLTHILNGLTNLEEIQLIQFEFTHQFKNILINYSRRHSARIINVYLDFKLKQIPPPFIAGTQPNFSYDLCECHANLRLWYVH